MRLLESLKDYGHEMHVAVKAMLADIIGMEITKEEARSLVDQMGLADVLYLDQAIDKKDVDAIHDLVNKYLKLS